MSTHPAIAVAPLFPRSHYRIIGQIGQGQFGRVYCAIHRETGKVYALKDLEHRVFPTNKFLREVAYLVILRHPNIVACHGLEYHAGGRFLVMDYCEGGTLRDIIEGEGELSLAGKIDLIYQILLGLDQAHQRNIIHCDLKPDNILLVPKRWGWQVKISDFGIARLTEITGNPNFGKGYTGSPAYMAPERFYGKFSPASDLYAVGIMLYELITGDRPFSGMPKALQAAHLNNRLTLPPSFPPELAPIVTKALEKLPQRRYSTALAMAQALGNLIAPTPDPFLRYQCVPPPPQEFPYTVKHSTPLLFPVDCLAAEGMWLYLTKGRELYMWEYGEGKMGNHPLPRWSLATPGRIRELQAIQGQISLLVQTQRDQWQVYQWQDRLLFTPKLPKPSITLQGDRLGAVFTPQGKRIATVTGSEGESKGRFQVWQIGRGQMMGAGHTLRFPSQLLAIDDRHGLVVQLVQQKDHTCSIFSLFNRRGTVFPAFHLSFWVRQLVVNRFSRNHLFGLAYDLPQTGVLLRLQPLKVNRIALTLHPQFIQTFPWGYLLASAEGAVALLDYEGFLLGNVDLGEPITAIAPVDRYQCLFATWQKDQGHLHLVDFGEQIEDRIRLRQEKDL